MKRLALTIYISLSALFTWGQNSIRVQLDSLQVVLTESKKSAERVDVLNQISKLYFGEEKYQSYDSALYYTRQALELADKTDYKKGNAKANYALGKYYVSAKDEPAEATKYFYRSLDIYKNLNDQAGISRCHMQLGIISYVLENYESAVNSFNLSLANEPNTTTKYLLAISYSELDSFDIAKRFFTRAISDYNDQGNKQYEIAHSYLWLGRMQLKTGNLDSAKHYLYLSIQVLRTKNESYALVRPYAFLSAVYLESNQIDSAIYYAEKSFEIESTKEGTKREKDPLSIIQASKVLNEAYIKKNNFKKAHFYLQRYNDEETRFKEGRTQQRVNEMQSRFIREKDREIAQQQIDKERILRNGFVVGSILLLLFLALLYSRFNIKKKANKELKHLNNEISHEKKRSDDLLLNILPADIAEELKQTGRAEARDFENVSILFTDFIKFTQTAEKLNAKELVEEINTCFEAFDHICEKYHIEKIKTIGDAYMAAGGLSDSSHNSVTNTVKAALEMQEFITKRRSEKEKTGQPTFEMRAGVHTGNVVAGIVGVKKFQYDIWGDVVNTAARAESSGESGQVNITADTFNLIKNEPVFNFQSRGKINAKGKGEIDMYFVSFQKS